jgi:hypothetical protein
LNDKTNRIKSGNFWNYSWLTGRGWAGENELRPLGVIQESAGKWLPQVRMIYGDRHNSGIDPVGPMVDRTHPDAAWANVGDGAGTVGQR